MSSSPLQHGSRVPVPTSAEPRALDPQSMQFGTVPVPLTTPPGMRSVSGPSHPIHGRAATIPDGDFRQGVNAPRSDLESSRSEVPRVLPAQRAPVSEQLEPGIGSGVQRGGLVHDHLLQRAYQS